MGGVVRADRAEARAARRKALPVVADAAGNLPLSPTDVAQFIRLDQCQRYLRLRLHERAVNRAFLRDYGVAPQSIPPLLTRSGAALRGAGRGGGARRLRRL